MQSSSKKIFILVGVAIFVFGSASLSAYLLFFKPYSSFHFFHSKKETPKQLAPAPDQGEVSFNAAVTLQNAGKLEEAISAWNIWLQAYPNSKKAPEALQNLGTANLELLRSASTAGGKESYIVVKGDSLARISAKKKSNPELIQQVNGLPNINLQIGQELFIPQLQMSVVIDRSKKLLLLQNGEQFFKSYPLLSAPPSSNGKESTTLIVDKIATSGNKRVAFGDKKYPTSERVIILRSSGNIVAIPTEVATIPSTPETTNATAATLPPTMPPGFVISTTDMSEIFPLLNKNASVTVK